MTKKIKKVEIKSRKKRCPNGSRRDKLSGFCKKYRGFSVFEELKDQVIKKEGTTISIESLEHAGVVIKVYHKGQLKEQNLVGPRYLEKGMEKSWKDLNNIMKTIRKIKRHPDLIRKDRQFQIFKKNVKSPVPTQKGGSSKKEENNEEEKPLVNLAVQHDVLKKVNSKEGLHKQVEIQELGLEMGMLSGDLKKEMEERHSEWFNSIWLFNFMTVVTTSIIAIGPWLVAAWNILISAINDFVFGVEEVGEGLAFVGEEILKGMEYELEINHIISASPSVPGVISGFTPGSNAGQTPGVNPGSTPGVNPGSTPGINPGSIKVSPGLNSNMTNYIKENDVEIDFYVGISLMMIDMIAIRFPNESAENIIMIAQYLFWSWLITTSVISGGGMLFQLIPVIVGLGYSLWLKQKHSLIKKMEKMKEEKFNLLKDKLRVAQLKSE
jgi:hypothetical protein